VSKKYSIQLVQFNNKYGSQVYLPYSIGILSSYALADKEILDKFEFKEFISIIESVPDLVKKIGHSWNFLL